VLLALEGEVGHDLKEFVAGGAGITLRRGLGYDGRRPCNLQKQAGSRVEAGRAEDRAVGAENRVVHDAFQVPDARPVGTGVNGGDAPPRRVGWHFGGAHLGGLLLQPGGVGGETLAQDRRRQNLDTRGERAANASPLGCGAAVANHAHQLAAPLKDGWVGGQCLDRLAVDLVFPRADRDLDLVVLRPRRRASAAFRKSLATVVG
jgi:hypothetical protein